MHSLTLYAYFNVFHVAGCGEHLVRTFLAKECGEALASTRYATLVVIKPSGQYQGNVRYAGVV